MNTPGLFKHQIDSVRFFQAQPRGFDMSDPGTGKTRVQIELYLARRHAGKALVLAPRSLLRSAWLEDFKKYAPQIPVSIATAKDREEAFRRPADVYVTNTDAVRWLVKQPPSFFKGYSTLIIDEISAFKHHTSQRSRGLNKIKKYFQYRYGLSGTPNSNTITDVWHPMFVLDDGKRLGKSFYQFRLGVCEPKQVGPQPNMLKWTDKPHAHTAVTALIKDMTIRHVFEECVDIPENFEYPVPYELEQQHLATYYDMQKEALIFVNGKVVSAVNAAVVINKLLQIASGAVYDQDGGYVMLDTGRYELVADLVEERAHSLVFFNWTHQRDELKKEFDKRGITYVVMDGQTGDKARAEAVELYQKGFYRVMLAHPQTASHGLTLVRGTSTIWASPTFNLEHFLQGNRRIYRLGQTAKTETIVILGAGTIDEEVYKRLQHKDVRQADLLDALAARSVP